MLGSWVALISKLFFKKPLLIRCGYEIFDAYRFQKKSPLFLYLIWLISFLAYRYSNSINVASMEDSVVVKKYFKINPNKIIVRPNWIDISVFKNYNVKKIKNRILFVGRLEEQKNIHLLLEALSGTTIGLDIVGDGRLKNTLIDESKELNVNVNFLGSFPNNKMVSIYNAYSIYVLCSPYEGNPKTLLEAMACGCAVIGTNVPGIKSIIEHYENGILVDESPLELRSAILKLLSNNLLTKRLALNSIEFIKNNNSLEKTILSEYDEYNRLLN